MLFLFILSTYSLPYPIAVIHRVLFIKSVIFSINDVEGWCSEIFHMFRVSNSAYYSDAITMVLLNPCQSCIVSIVCLESQPMKTMIFLGPNKFSITTMSPISVKFLCLCACVATVASNAPSKWQCAQLVVPDIGRDLLRNLMITFNRYWRNGRNTLLHRMEKIKMQRFHWVRM